VLKLKFSYVKVFINLPCIISKTYSTRCLDKMFFFKFISSSFYVFFCNISFIVSNAFQIICKLDKIINNKQEYFRSFYGFKLDNIIVKSANEWYIIYDYN